MRTFVVAFSLILGISVAAEAKASLIPPHKTVITQCGKVHTVQVVTAKDSRIYHGGDAVIQAKDVPTNLWLEAGCPK